jgi:hypothetical protein
MGPSCASYLVIHVFEISEFSFAVCNLLLIGIWLTYFMFLRVPYTTYVANVLYIERTGRRHENSFSFRAEDQTVKR